MNRCVRSRADVKCSVYVSYGNWNFTFGFELDRQQLCAFTSAYEMSSISNGFRQSNDVMSIFQHSGHYIANLSSGLLLVMSFIKKVEIHWLIKVR